jgi:hypothetical protein
MRQEAMRTLLQRVQDSRNALAHFRGQLTAHERSNLKVCAEWFAMRTIPAGNAATVTDVVVVPPLGQTELSPVDESGEAAQGRYARLASWLNEQPASATDVTASFDEIEVAIESALPRSAFAHRSWWANDSVSHPQSLNWLDVGWRVANANLTNRTVTFTRIEGRQGAYINFFSLALRSLRERSDWEVAGQPTGSNWQLLVGIASEGRQRGILAWTFARRRRFRTELYIDSGDVASNKRLFDALRAEHARIETSVGHPLTWERMEERRASRIASYMEGSIQDSPERLLELRDWAVQAALDMHDHLLAEARRLG